MNRRHLMLAAGLALAALTAPAFAQNAEKPKLTLGVGGKQLLYYLPLTVAEKKGYFKEQGLDVEINDFGGGAKSLQALVGGSVDVVTGAYEHTIRMQAKGQAPVEKRVDGSLHIGRGRQHARLLQREAGGGAG